MAIVYPLGPTWEERFSRRSEAVKIANLAAYEGHFGSVHVGPTVALFWWLWRWEEVAPPPGSPGADFPWTVVELEVGDVPTGRYKWPRTFESNPWPAANLFKNHGADEPPPDPGALPPIIEGEITIFLPPDPISAASLGGPGLGWLVLIGAAGMAWWVWREDS